MFQALQSLSLSVEANEGITLINKINITYSLFFLPFEVWLESDLPLTTLELEEFLSAWAMPLTCCTLLPL